MTYPICVQCGHTKHPIHARGLCKDCYNRPYCLAWRCRNPEKIKAKNLRWYQNNKERVAILNQNWHKRNRSKMNAINLAWNKAHPEKVKESQAKFRKNHSEQRAQSRMPKAYWSLRYKLLFIENRPCIQCGSYKQRQLHHIIPSRLGGSYTPDNLEVRCFPCHSKFHHTTKTKMII